ncbi:MAG TPA: GNAT family N-acetyltransferase [Spirochaetota bacterium]|nr:GNAT family N-acetyltransferase [Spirochaetota bacterium]HOL56300.1 GNAT family N-acetyltransferase [Spirochaetota bacterium]HPP03690.1 GNAT family N-acetyltransferase [Spirochaetota bacterium]
MLIKKAKIIFKNTKVNLNKEKLLETFRLCGYKVDNIDHIIKNSHKILVAYNNEEIIGFLTTLSNGRNFVYYDLLGVKKEYRRMGIGSKLIAFMSRHYKNIPFHYITSKKDMLKFFKKFGFEIAIPLTNKNIKNMEYIPLIKIVEN